jgi:peptidoglycan/LPS O-acetylase OafA/YrhL
LARATDPIRLPGLDMLRAVAIVWVMVCHANGFGLLPSDYFGWMGVDLFFVLSGFLIGGQLFRPIARGGRPDYGNFIARRLLRTLPAYLAVLALYFAFPVLRDHASMQPAWQFLTFTQNLLIDPSKSNTFSQAWSLCVEEQFYLLLPLVIVAFGPGATPKRTIALIAVVLAIGVALRAWLWLGFVARPPFGLTAAPGSGAYMRYIYYPTWTRLDGLLAGVSLALVRAFRPRLWSMVVARPNLLLTAGLLGVAASILFFDKQIAGFLPSVLGFPLLAASMAALVAAGSEPRSIIGRAALPGAGALAAASYSLYLSHKMAYRAVIRLMHDAAPQAHEVTLVLAIGAALLVGAALYLLVERPFLRLRDRFRSPAPADSLGVAVAAE